MATSPRIPPDQRGPVPVDRETLRPKRPSSGWPGVLAAIVLLLLLLGAVFYFLPRTPKATAPPVGADVPPQPTGDQLQFSNVKISRAPAGGAMFLQGTVMNTGTTAVNGVVVEVRFNNEQGQVLTSEQINMIGLRDDGSEQPLTETPIRPNENRAFRLHVTQVPQGWKERVPDLRIVAVTAHQP
jgi:hypothetical protein